MSVHSYGLRTQVNTVEAGALTDVSILAIGCVTFFIEDRVYFNQSEII